MITNQDALYGATAIGMSLVAIYFAQRTRVLQARLKRSYDYAEGQLEAADFQTGVYRERLRAVSEALGQPFDDCGEERVEPPPGAGLHVLFSSPPLPRDDTMRPAFTQGVDREMCGGCGRSLSAQEIARCKGKDCPLYKMTLDPMPR